MGWSVRFSLMLEISRGLEYPRCVVGSHCTPPVIHGDIKPSNILIDCEYFKVKIGNFGLVIVKSEDLVEEEKEVVRGEDNGSILEERSVDMRRIGPRPIEARQARNQAYGPT